MASALIETLAGPLDARGWVVEPLSSEQIHAQNNVHLVWSLPGVIRGNHYHELGTETLIIPGPALLRWRENGRILDRTIPEGQICRAIFPPGIPHAIQNTGSRPLLLLTFNTRSFNPAQPDTIRDPLL